MGTLLIIDQLPHDYNELELTALLKPFGHVVSARLIRDHLNRSLGFGFAEMEDLQEALSAVVELNGSELRGHTLLVSLVSDPHGRDID
jgi:RNA recognition motif-containing protein